LPLDAYGRLRYYLTSLARETDRSVVVQGLWTAAARGACRMLQGDSAEDPLRANERQLDPVRQAANYHPTTAARGVLIL
jgi:hypothetical protein